MKDLMDKSSIIKLKEQGYSNKKVEKMLKINIKTIAKYWNEYQTNIEKLNNTKDDLEIKEIQEKIVAEPKYNSKNRVKRKITPEFITALKNILNDELEKEKILGTNKQALTKLQIYELLKKQGFFVFALDRKIGEAEENVFPIEADITDESSLARAAETIKKKTDALFAIVHYAGIYMLDSLAEIERESFERIFRINLFGAFLVNKTFLPFLRKGGRIVITTSELAPLDPLPFTGLYAVTKSALDKYAYSLRMELQLLGISVSVLRAGAVKTDMLGVSTSALDVFCEKTKLYKNKRAKKFGLY